MSATTRVETHPNHRVLFEPLRIGPVTAQNRFYQVPHGPNSGNFPDIDQGIKGVRAEGGWGVVSCEICSIHPSSEGTRDLLHWQRAAALRAKQAGFDIVYVYAATESPGHDGESRFSATAQPLALI